MSEQLRLLCVLAHPDDESLGFGGTLAKYAREGIETYLVTATRGERGRFGSGIDFPGFSAVGRMREAELLAAAKELGLREVRFLDYMDGELDHAKPGEVIARIVAELRRVRPHIVLTFGPEGAYRHPDHIAICQFATAATICAPIRPILLAVQPYLRIEFRSCTTWPGVMPSGRPTRQGFGI